jgi:hypothetical protein
MRHLVTAALEENRQTASSRHGILDAELVSPAPGKRVV